MWVVVSQMPNHPTQNCKTFFFEIVSVIVAVIVGRGKGRINPYKGKKKPYDVKSNLEVQFSDLLRGENNEKKKYYGRFLKYVSKWSPGLLLVDSFYCMEEVTYSKVCL